MQFTQRDEARSRGAVQKVRAKTDYTENRKRRIKSVTLLQPLSFMKTCHWTLLFRVMPPLVAAIALPGCIFLSSNRRTYDVSSNPAWWGEMHRGEIVALNEDTLLDGSKLTLGAFKDNGTYDSQRLFGGPITVEMFKANPGKYWEDLHSLPKATRFRCIKLARWYSYTSSGYNISAEILDGEFKGKIVCIYPYGGEPDKKGSFKLKPASLVHPVEQGAER
jgi:hypothetical protein